METVILNGMSGTTGFNRVATNVERVNGFNRAVAEGSNINGFNRATYESAMQGYGTCKLEGYELNGYMLSGLMELEDEEFDAVIDAIDSISLDELQGYELGFFGKKAKARRAARREKRKDKKSERRARRDAKRQARADRKAAKMAAKQEKRDLKNEMRQARIEKKRARAEKIRSKIGEPGFGDKLLSLGEKAVQAFTGDGAGDIVGIVEDATGFDIPLPDLSDDFGIGDDEFITEMSDQDMDERGLFGPPSLFEKPGKWFRSKQVPVWQKAGVVAGGVLLIDGLTGGNIVLKRVGIMKGKKR